LKVLHPLFGWHGCQLVVLQGRTMASGATSAVDCLQTAEIDVAADPDSADTFGAADPDKAPPPQEEEEVKKERPEKKGVLRDYIESFDQRTLADTARCGNPP